MGHGAGVGEWTVKEAQVGAGCERADLEWSRAWARRQNRWATGVRSWQESGDRDGGERDLETVKSGVAQAGGEKH